MKVGVFGGSFDPPHIGHLIMAEAVFDQLALDLVLFVPTGVQPLKQDRHATPAEQRAAMTTLAIANNPRFQLSRADVDHPGPSYTVDTLGRLRQEWGTNVEFWFIIGQDSLATLLAWRDPAGIIAQARLAVVGRPGVVVDRARLDQELPQLAGRLDNVTAPLIGISASELRQSIAAGHSIRYQVPAAVADYIGANKLYQEKL